MKQTQRILLAVVLLLMCIVSYQNKNDVTALNERVSNTYRQTQNEIYKMFDGVYNEIDGLNKKFDLSVLESCGIITNGLGFGSCVVIGPDLILTAGHCEWSVEHWIEVGGVRYEIIEEWASESRDVRLIKIEGILPYVELGQMPELFETVYLVGSPYEITFVNSITKGIISHLDRDIWGWEDLIQTDAEGAPGSSGCPLFNKSGQVIGICVSGVVPGGGVTLCESVDSIRLALAEYLDR